MSPSRSTVFLLAAWTIAMVLAALSAGILAAGVVRDTRATEPSLDVSLGAPSGWIRVPFRIWRSGRYKLFISTVNHDPERVGRRFSGEVEVLIQRPDGTTFYQERLQGDTIPHLVPSNYGDTELALVTLDRSRVRRWTMAVRVSRPDAQFTDLRSQVKLWRERSDPGMGGLVNYVMIIPAGFFAIVALLVALSLARRSIRMPLFVSCVALLATLVWSAS